MITPGTSQPRKTVTIPVPRTLPLGFEITPSGVQEVWDTFVKPTHSDNAPPQSIEVRMLAGILRAVYAGMTEAQETNR